MVHAVNDPFAPFVNWLEWLDSHDGRLYRRSRGQTETDADLAGTLPNPPGNALFTVGDLRALVAAGRELVALRITLHGRARHPASHG